MARSPITWLVIVTAAAVPLYLGFIIYASWDDVASAVSGFPLPLLLPILFLNLASHGIRALRWNCFLNHLKVDVSHREGLLLYFAGLSMLLTPALLSGAVRVWLVKVKEGTGVSRTLPIIMAERLTDLLGLMVLAMVGILSFGFGFITIGATLVVMIIVIMVLRRPSLIRRGMAHLHRRWPGSDMLQALDAAIDSSYTLLNPRLFGLTTLLSLASWSFTWVAFYLVIQGFEVDMAAATTCFVFAFPVILGLVSQIPGGLVAEEGGIVALLHEYKEVALGTATAVALVYRLVTLWFSVLVGLASLVWFKHHHIEDSSLMKERNM